MKLERAKRQKQEFDDVLRSFFSTTPYKFTGKLDFESNKIIYTMDEVQPVPSEVPLIAGDIIHNLRSALDHLAYQLFRKKHPDREGKHVQFPIAETKVDYYRKEGVSSIEKSENQTGAQPGACRRSRMASHGVCPLLVRSGSRRSPTDA